MRFLRNALSLFTLKVSLVKMKFAQSVLIAGRKGVLVRLFGKNRFLFLFENQNLSRKSQFDFCGTGVFYNAYI